MVESGHGDTVQETWRVDTILGVNCRFEPFDFGMSWHVLGLIAVSQSCTAKLIDKRCCSCDLSTVSQISAHFEIECPPSPCAVLGVLDLRMADIGWLYNGTVSVHANFMIHWHDLKQGISKHSISTMADANQHNLKQDSAFFCANLGAEFSSNLSVVPRCSTVPRWISGGKQHNKHLWSSRTFPNGSTELALSGAQAEHPGRDQEEIFRGSQAAAGDASDLG